ncbi:MAG: IclR family transcriptional regulator [Burkholderiaceae bacterium]
MPQIIPTAQRAMQVFEVFARERRPLTNSELARFLDLADSSCSDLLHTLREAGYLLRTPRSRTFYPTTRLLDVGQRIGATDPVLAFATEALELLTKRSSETSMCGILEGRRVKIVACQESPRALRYVLQPGAVVDVHATALGKALLGTMAEREADALIDALPMAPVTGRTIVDRAVLRAQVADGRARGWHEVIDEGSEGVMALAIAGPVDGRLAALSIVGPIHRLRQQRDAYGALLVAARAELFG